MISLRILLWALQLFSRKFLSIFFHYQNGVFSIRLFLLFFVRLELLLLPLIIIYSQFHSTFFPFIDEFIPIWYSILFSYIFLVQDSCSCSILISISCMRIFLLVNTFMVFVFEERLFWALLSSETCRRFHFRYINCIFALFL